MKKQTRNIITIIAVLGLILSVYLIISPLIKSPIVGGDKNSSGCDYNSLDKSYIKKDPNCMINFLCVQGTNPFKDQCGCGCEKINSEPEKTYCTPEQKNAEVCPEYYSATCGWFNQSIKCIKYPCAETFSNPCFACASPSTEYYTPGDCPK